MNSVNFQNRDFYLECESILHYFPRFFRVFTLISLLVALEETCLPSTLSYLLRARLFSAKMQGSKAASKSVLQLWRNRGSTNKWGYCWLNVAQNRLVRRCPRNRLKPRLFGLQKSFFFANFAIFRARFNPK